MKKIIIIYMVMLFITGSLCAYGYGSGPDSTWAYTFGGSKSDCGKSVQQTTDGGYIITGYTESYGAGVRDVYLIKTDASGDTAWTKTYGGSKGDEGKSVQQTTDGGYIITGYTLSNDTGYANVYLIKTDASGDTTWTKTYGGSDNDGGYSVQQTTDGGYIITGFTYSYGAGEADAYLIKTDASGDTTWTKTYGGSDNDCGNSVQQTSDGGYIITGYTESYGAGYADVYLIKTDASGDTTWTKTYGGSDNDDGYSVQRTSDGGYIITGYTESYGAGVRDVYLIKTDASGDTTWTKTYGGDDSDCGYSVQQTTDGGYVIAGCAYFYHGLWKSNEVYLIKTDALGDTTWTEAYGGGDGDGGYSVQQSMDGSSYIDYIIVGYTSSYGAGNSDVWLIKVDSDDTLPVELSAFTALLVDNELLLSWHTQSETDNLGWNIYRNTSEDFASSSLLTKELIKGHGTTTEPSYYNYTDTGELTIGETYYYWLESIGYSGTSEVHTMRAEITIPDPSTIPPSIEPPIVYNVKNIPNPISTSAQFKFTLDKEAVVSVSIYNIKGELVKTLPSVIAQEDETESIYWNGKDSSGRDLAPGIYFYNLLVNDKVAETNKLILVK